MTGTPNQIEWAEQIKPTINAEFDRVAAAFTALAATQPEPTRSETLTIVQIIEEQRTEVMSNPSAGYFISHWRELSDQVRHLIAADPRHKKMQLKRTAKVATVAV